MKIGFLSFKGDFLVYPGKTTVDLREIKGWITCGFIDMAFALAIITFVISDKLESVIVSFWLELLIEILFVTLFRFITLTIIGNILVAISKRKHKKEENEIEENNI